jgi:hypothetical protein
MNKVILLYSLLVVLMSGCATQRILLGGESNKDPDYQKSQAFWLGGEFQNGDVDAEKICQDRGVYKIESVQSFGDTLLGTITVGFYTPRTIKIYCNKNAEYHIDKKIGNLLKDNMKQMLGSMGDMETQMGALQDKIHSLQDQLNSDVDAIKQKIKAIKLKCNCNQKVVEGHCANLEVYENKSCVQDIPKDSDLKLIPQGDLGSEKDQH